MRIGFWYWVIQREYNAKQLPVILRLPVVHWDRLNQHKSVHMFFPDPNHRNDRAQNGHLMVHIQRLLPTQIKIPSPLHHHDCLHHPRNNPLPPSLHLQLLHIQFRPIRVHLPHVLLWAWWYDLLHLHTQEFKTGLCAYYWSFQAEDPCV